MEFDNYVGILVGIVFVLLAFHSLLVILKIYTLAIAIPVWNYKYGRNLGNYFYELISKNKYEDALNYHDQMISKRSFIFKSLLSYFPDKLYLKKTIRCLYSWPVLTIFTAILLVVFSELELTSSIIEIHYYTIFLTTLLFLLLVAEILHELSSRLFLGVADNIKQYMRVDLDAKNTYRYHTNKILSDFILVLTTQLTVFTFSFACIYLFISKINTESFGEGQITSIFDAFYFSVVTFTTTGYGEIHPISEIAKFLVMTQIGFTYLLVVLLAGHFFATAMIRLR